MAPAWECRTTVGMNPDHGHGELHGHAPARRVSMLSHVLMALVLLGFQATALSGERRGIEVLPPPEDPGVERTFRNAGSISRDCPDLQVVPGMELRLADALLMAICRDPKLRKAGYEIDERHAMRGAAMARYWPTINGEITTNLFRKDVEYQSTPFANYTLRGASGGAALSLRWLLADFGGRRGELESATRTLEAALWGKSDLGRSLAIAVVETFFRARSSTASALAFAEGERLARESASNAEVLHRGGIASPSDVLLAQASVAQIQLKRAQSESDMRTAISDLAAQLSLPRWTELAVSTEELEAGHTLSLQMLKESLNDVISVSPRVLAAEHQVRAAEARVRVAKSEGMPTLSLTGSAYRTLTPPMESITAQTVTGASIGLQVTIPIFEGYLRKERVQAAIAQYDARVADMGIITREVEAEVWKGHESLSLEREKLVIAGRQVEITRKAFLVSAGRYKAGVGAIVELLKAQSDLVEAEQQEVKVKADWQAAKLRLAIMLGEMQVPELAGN